MARMTKVNLVVGIICLALGLLVSLDVLDSKAHPMRTFALPAGAICLGLFFISYIFEKETARFDAEQPARLKTGSATQPPKVAAAQPLCPSATVEGIEAHQS